MRFPLELVDEILLIVIETKFKQQGGMKELLKFDRARYLLGKMFAIKPRNIYPVVDLTRSIISNVQSFRFYDHERLENSYYVLLKRGQRIGFYFKNTNIENSHPVSKLLTEDRIKKMIKKICPYIFLIY